MDAKGRLEEFYTNLKRSKLQTKTLSLLRTWLEPCQREELTFLQNWVGGMGKLRLFVDRMSQPSRAILIFCMANGIDAEEHFVNVAKFEHRKPEYKSINPMGLVPAIDDNGFYLFESHAMLRYLACAYPNVKDHWYPADLRKRAQIECILDWHHTGLRRGSAGVVMNRVIAPMLGRALNLEAAEEAEKVLKASLKMMETLWLKDSGSFLTGSLQPSIADLSLACEVMQLQLLDKDNVSELLDPNPKVKKWLVAVERSLSPHFTEVHEKLRKAASMYQQRREQEKKKAEPADASSSQPKL